MYLNLHLLSAIPWQHNPQLTVVELRVNEDVQRIYPTIFQGGQRLLLPEDATQYIIALLSQGECCTLALGRSQINIIPINFDDCYEQLISLPIDCSAN